MTATPKQSGPAPRLSIYARPRPGTNPVMLNSLYFGRNPATAKISNGITIRLALAFEAARTGQEIRAADVKRAYADFGAKITSKEANKIAEQANALYRALPSRSGPSDDGTNLAIGKITQHYRRDLNAARQMQNRLNRKNAIDEKLVRAAASQGTPITEKDIIHAYAEASLPIQTGEAATIAQNLSDKAERLTWQRLLSRRTRRAILSSHTVVTSLLAIALLLTRTVLYAIHGYGEPEEIYIFIRWAVAPIALWQAITLFRAKRAFYVALALCAAAIILNPLHNVSLYSETYAVIYAVLTLPFIASAITEALRQKALTHEAAPAQEQS